VWLCEISPRIWRRLLVRSDSTSADLHHTLQIAMGWDDALVAVKDAVHTTDSPQQIFAAVDAWAKQGWDHRVTAVLLFVSWQPPTAVTEDIQKRTGGQTFAGGHDLFSGRHWMSNYLGMEQEIYGDEPGAGLGGTSRGLWSRDVLWLRGLAALRRWGAITVALWIEREDVRAVRF
jgi:Plasmid pRiA4b ORF-3-like protein